jgi:putative nucleotidyltransferase with HDIG domain
MSANTIQQIEDYARQVMAEEVAHDFKHADRVRRWALQIARSEGYEDLEILEAAALLHDIGLAPAEQRGQHGRIGAEMAAKFLRENGLFAEEEIEEIANAIRYHNSLRDGAQLLDILRDADALDQFGAVGIMRALTSQSARPEYDPRNVKGDTWGMTSREYDQQFAEGEGIGAYIVDQVNFQISNYGNLRTETAKRIAAPLVALMKAYMMQLESEISAGRKGVG